MGSRFLGTEAKVWGFSLLSSLSSSSNKDDSSFSVRFYQLPAEEAPRALLCLDFRIRGSGCRVWGYSFNASLTCLAPNSKDANTFSISYDSAGSTLGAENVGFSRRIMEAKSITYGSWVQGLGCKPPLTCLPVPEQGGGQQLLRLVGLCQQPAQELQRAVVRWRRQLDVEALLGGDGGDGVADLKLSLVGGEGRGERVEVLVRRNVSR